MSMMAAVALAASTACGSDGGPVAATEVEAFDLEIGHCFNAAGSDEVERVELVACTDDHAFEIYHVFRVDDGPYPGPEALEDQWIQGCLARFETFVGSTFDESTLDISAIFPTEESWEQLGDREVLCSVTAVDGSPRTSSARGTGV